MRLIPVRSALLLGLMACHADEDAGRISPAELLLGGEVAVGFAVDSVAGGAPLSVGVRAFNRFGAPTGAEPVVLQVEDALYPVSFDGSGYGRLILDTPGVHVVHGADEPAVAWVEAEPWPGVALPPAAAAPGWGASQVVALSSGGAVAVHKELWWVGPAGQTHRVLQADGPIEGLRARHLDVDALLDVIVWTATEIYLLRGRPEGLSWGAGLRAPGHLVASVDAADLDGDKLADLAIAWVRDGGEGLLDVHHGDGLFGFVPTTPSVLQSTPSSLGIGDNVGSGSPQITVLQRDGSWVRYLAARAPDRPDAPSQYVRIGPAPPASLILPLDGTIDADGDLDGDGADQLWIHGPQTGGERTIYLVSLHGKRTEYLPMSPPDPFLSRADANGDGLLDLLLLHDDGVLHAMHYNPVTEAYVPRPLGWVRDHAPFALGDFRGEGRPDLLVAAEHTWKIWPAGPQPEDPTSFWELAPTGEEAMGGSQGVLLRHTASSGQTELLTLEQADGISRLVMHRWNGSTLVRRGQVQLSPDGALPLDLALCDQGLWVLLADELLRIGIGNSNSPGITARAPMHGSRVSCGEGPSGAVAAVLGEGEVHLLGPDLSLLETLEARGARDLALGDVGSGPQLGLCHTSECEVIYWPWGDAGEASFARIEEGWVHLDPGLSYMGHGAPSLADVDGDGRLDLILAEPGGGVSILRSAGSAVIPPRGAHLPTRLQGPVAAADTDGDGTAELWWLDLDGELYLSAPSSAP